MSERVPDPRGTRVSLAVPLDGLEPIVVEPPQVPPLPVLVDGAPVWAGLARIDDERATLLEGDGASPSRILLLPPSHPPGGGDGISRQEVVVDGWRIEVAIESAARAALRERATRGRQESTHSGPTEVRAIIPGAVVALSVAVGDAVTAGAQLLVVEAMKMQNELRAPRDGTVERIAVGPGSKIEVGDLLVVLS